MTQERFKNPVCLPCCGHTIEEAVIKSGLITKCPGQIINDDFEQKQCSELIISNRLQKNLAVLSVVNILYGNDHAASIDDAFRCPVSAELFAGGLDQRSDKEAVMIMECGHTVSRKSIEDWFANHDTCPYDGVAAPSYPSCTLTPNKLLNDLSEKYFSLKRALGRGERSGDIFTPT